MSKAKELINLLEAEKHDLKIGDKVTLNPDVLSRHARSVPAHMGYTHQQFQWRDILGKLKDKVGTIERTFPNSKHVNVAFDGEMIGINSTELIKQGEIK